MTLSVLLHFGQRPTGLPDQKPILPVQPGFDFAEILSVEEIAVSMGPERTDNPGAAQEADLDTADPPQQFHVVGGDGPHPDRSLPQLGISEPEIFGPNPTYRGAELPENVAIESVKLHGLQDGSQKSAHQDGSGGMDSVLPEQFVQTLARNHPIIEGKAHQPDRIAGSQGFVQIEETRPFAAPIAVPVAGLPTPDIPAVPTGEPARNRAEQFSGVAQDWLALARAGSAQIVDEGYALRPAKPVAEKNHIGDRNIHADWEEKKSPVALPNSLERNSKPTAAANPLMPPERHVLRIQETVPAPLTPVDPVLTGAVDLTWEGRAPTAFEGRPVLSQAGGTVARQVLAQVQIVLQKEAQNVELRLNPAELGRVRMAMHQSDGALGLILTVERPETLDLLRRHSGMLASEFKDAGFANLSFEFRQEQGSTSQTAAHPERLSTDEMVETPADALQSNRGRISNGTALDIMI